MTVPHGLGMEELNSRIHTIRGKTVMLDRDLAFLYGVQTKVLNQAVRRNNRRFPDDFMFQLSGDESAVLRSQTVTLKAGRGRHIKYLPYAFTEQGVAMLSSVLGSDKAIEVNIQIMRAFVRMRELVALSSDLRLAITDLEKRVGRHEIKLQVAFKLLQKLLPPMRIEQERKMGFGKA